MRLLPAPRQVIRQFRTRPIRVAGVVSATTVAALVAFTIAATPAEAAVGTVLGADRADAVAGQYIVVLKNGAMDRAGVGRLPLDPAHSGGLADLGVVAGGGEAGGRSVAAPRCPRAPAPRIR